jgi:16S rRNA (adenine1518-N6/adenine1519-N6)-dimethyltransferase
VTLSRREVADLLARHDLRPRRALGQNFVVDPNTVRRIARLAGVTSGDHVLEIGAGLGSLTLALAETGASVTAVETDSRLLPILGEVVAGSGVTIVAGDALHLDLTELLGDDRWVLVANLPYNVATPLVLNLLERAPVIERMLVMVQREVAERLAARVGDEGFGAVSVKVAYWAKAEVAGSVPANVFLPKPKVESALVHIERRPAPPIDPALDRERVFELIDQGFGQRRKMLRRSLAGVVDAATFACASIRPEARAEELTIEDWGRLAACNT